MGNIQGGQGGGQGNNQRNNQRKINTRKNNVPVQKLKKHKEVTNNIQKLPDITPNMRCRLKLLKMERIKDYLLIEKEFVNNKENQKKKKEEFKVDNENLTEEEQGFELVREKVKEIRKCPLTVGNLDELVDENHAIVSVVNGPEYYVPILSFVDRNYLEPNCSILCHNKNMSVVGILKDDSDPLLNVMKVEHAPKEKYSDIGGLEDQIMEIKEAVELPLSKPEIYEELGIKPPKGVILYGPPGTGKTLLVKAVAHQTSATFLRLVGSELIQKYLGDGPKLVRELFKLAEKNSPSIVFIDEIDAVGTKRYNSNSGGEKEIQRTMLELLNQLDGFDAHSNVKVILATNQIEKLDPALIRPGRIDRKIEFPYPDFKTLKKIMQIHTSKMTLDNDVNLDSIINCKENFTGADVKAICTEAGMTALRERRMKIKMVDLQKAKEKTLALKKGNIPEGLFI